jgi:hypothetical protein
MTSVLGARRWRSNAVPRVRPPAAPPWGHVIELELNGYGGGWTDVTADVLMSTTINWNYGIMSADPTSFMGDIGTLTFVLDNSENNVGATLGWYTPDGVHVRAGFRRGIRVRYRYKVPYTYDYYTKFVGRLIDAVPSPGRYAERQVACSCVDWMYEAVNSKLILPVQLAKRSDQVVSAIVATVPIPPGATQYDIGDSTFPFSLNNPSASQTTAGAELSRVCDSEAGKFYLRGLKNTEFMLARYEKRSARLVPIPVASFIGSMKGLSMVSDIRNKVKVTAHPTSSDPSNVVLYSKPGTLSIFLAAGQTVKVVGRYVDPAVRGAVSVSGTAMVDPPVINVDYGLNSAADGTGTNLSANLVMAATFGSNQVEYLMTNTGVVGGFVWLLQARGIGLYDYVPTSAVQINASSIAQVGESIISLDQPYQNDLAIADAIAQFWLGVWSTPGFASGRLQFTPHDLTEMDLAMSLEPGDPIAVSEEVTGVNGIYYIMDAAGASEENNWGTFEWGLQRALTSNYWTLGVAGFTELGISTILAPL